jgi:NAD(P)-dependent dehydrogenase (short-subunit alcohol dehydrogenase family)
MRNASERTILITGATDGLGRRVAEDLAGLGATLLLHGRSPDKGEAVLAAIRDATGNTRLRYYNADLSSLAEVRRLAEAVAADQPCLDVLVNNAGLGAGPRPKERETSADGFELRFAVNYLAPFLLTRMLLPLLRRAAADKGGARIVNVSSAAQQTLDFADPMLERDYSGMRAYSQSKLALVMFSFDLARELAGSGVTVNALHPASLMNTKMVREWFGTPRSTVEEGARAVERLVLTEELAGVTGEYFEGQRQARAAAQADDEEARRRLRQMSERWVGL